MSERLPVSHALRIPAGAPEQPLREALASIDSVHQDGALPEIPAYMNILQAGEGVYVRHKRTRQPLAIVIDPRAKIPQAPFVHEVGHFLDHQALGKRGSFASESDDHLAGWKEAVSRSRSYQWLQQLAGYRIVSVDYTDGTSQRHEIRHKYREYLLRDRELFARSYTQYITHKCHNEEMKAELEYVRRKPLEEVYHRQWADDDFVAIEAALDAVFSEMGWLL